MGFRAPRQPVENRQAFLSKLVAASPRHNAYSRRMWGGQGGWELGPWDHLAQPLHFADEETEAGELT